MQKLLNYYNINLKSQGDVNILLLMVSADEKSLRSNSEQILLIIISAVKWLINHD